MYRTLFLSHLPVQFSVIQLEACFRDFSHGKLICIKEDRKREYIWKFLVVCLLVEYDSINFSVCGTAENNPGNLFLGGPSVKINKTPKAFKAEFWTRVFPGFIVKGEGNPQGGTPNPRPSAQGRFFFLLFGGRRLNTAEPEKVPLNLTPICPGPPFQRGQNRPWPSVHYRDPTTRVPCTLAFKRSKLCRQEIALHVAGPRLRWCEGSASLVRKILNARKNWAIAINILMRYSKCKN